MKKVPKYCQRCGMERSEPTGRCDNCGKRTVAPHLIALFWTLAGAMSAILALLTMLFMENTQIKFGPAPQEIASVQQNSPNVNLGYGLVLMDGDIAITEVGPVCYFEGRIRNDSGKEYKTVDVYLNYFDKEGNQVGTTLVMTRNLKEGITWIFSKGISRKSQRITSCRISSITVM